MKSELLRDLLLLPLHYLYYLDDFDAYDGIDDRGFQYLLDKYEDRELPLARAGVAWAAKNPGVDYANVAPYEGYPYTKAQFHFYLQRFHETLEHQIHKNNYTLPVRFDQPVQRLTPIQQQAHRIKINNGRLTGMKGPLDTTQSSRLFGPTGSAMYVLLANGTLLSMPHGPAGLIHHSTLAGNQPVACAGDLQARNGQLLAINRRSGHYQTTPTMLQQVIHHLTTNGIDTTTVEINGL